MRTTCSLPAILKTSDEDLIAAIAAGDRDAMGTLFTRHSVSVYRFIVRFTRDASLAEDIVSDVFLTVWRGAAGFKQNSQVLTWLLAIARYKAIAALKRSSHERLEDQTAMTALVAADNPEASANQTSRRAVIKRCLMQLPEPQRELLDLVYYHERTLEQVAEIIGIPRGTVKTRVFYARKRMTELLRDAGIREFNS
jgi:RNA polymerase sigma-70 factor (ECF subfamily)